MDQHVQVEPRHAIKQVEPDIIIKLRLQQIFHPKLFDTHHRVGRATGRVRELKREDADLVGRENEVELIELPGRELVDAQEDT
jgi:hypothetical protein